MTETPTSVPASVPAGTDAALSPELAQVRATVDALHNAAAMLQSAIDQRHALAAEMSSVEQSLAASQAELARAEGKVALTRAEQSGVMTELETMVQAALSRRSALVNEINELERKRDVLSVLPKPVLTQPHTPALSHTPAFTQTPACTPALTPVLSQREREAEVAAPSQREATARPRRVSLSLPAARHWITVLLGTILFGLALLVTPISQVVGGLQLLAVMSGSMEPSIHVGGIVGVRPVPASALQVGDVITFVNTNSPDIPITHRIVNLENHAGQTFITTKGDANDTVDAVTTTPNRAVGRVEFTAPWLGYLMVWLASPLAKGAILAISVIGFALPSIRLPTRKRAQPVSVSDRSYNALANEIQALLPNTS